MPHYRGERDSFFPHRWARTSAKCGRRRAAQPDYPVYQHPTPVKAKQNPLRGTCRGLDCWNAKLWLGLRGLTLRNNPLTRHPMKRAPVMALLACVTFVTMLPTKADACWWRHRWWRCCCQSSGSYGYSNGGGGSRGLVEASAPAHRWGPGPQGASAGDIAEAIKLVLEQLQARQTPVPAAPTLPVLPAISPSAGLEPKLDAINATLTQTNVRLDTIAQAVAKLSAAKRAAAHLVVSPVAGPAPASIAAAIDQAVATKVDARLQQFEFQLKLMNAELPGKIAAAVQAAIQAQPKP